MSFYLRLCERVTQFRSVVSRRRICFGCETRKYGLERCPRCKMTYFCSRVRFNTPGNKGIILTDNDTYKACQNESLSRKGHRRDCGIIRDPDITDLLLERWEQLGEFRSVSLQAHLQQVPDIL